MHLKVPANISVSTTINKFSANDMQLQCKFAHSLLCNTDAPLDSLPTFVKQTQKPTQFSNQLIQIKYF